MSIVIEQLFKKRDTISYNIAQLQLKIRELGKIRKSVDEKILEASKKTGISNEKIEKLDKSKIKRISAKRRDEISLRTMKVLGVKEPSIVMKEISKRIDEAKKDDS